MLKHFKLVSVHTDQQRNVFEMYRIVGKRLLDIISSFAALVVLSPLLALTALSIRLEDGGPSLFRQRRVGQKGREFILLKFRSMPVNATNVPSGQAQTHPITKVGRIIRRTNFDEIPQLINILKGDMSMVGPRPALPVQEELVEMRRRNGSLDCRPGLTGLAQINAYDAMPEEEKAKWDGECARKQSLSLDIKIILNTFKYLKKPPPVY